MSAIYVGIVLRAELKNLKGRVYYLMGFCWCHHVIAIAPVYKKDGSYDDVLNTAGDAEFVELCDATNSDQICECMMSTKSLNLPLFVFSHRRIMF